jgi:NADPH2:quinone reductase
MRAWQIRTLGEPEQVLRLGQVADPVAGDTQLLVRVLGTALGFPDVLMCRGEYQTKPVLPYTPGAEICGEVIATGSGSSTAVGDRVLGVATGMIGGLAECAVMDSTLAMPAPAELSDAQAATLFSAYQTGWFALHRRAQLRSGEVLVVQAAAGGVGMAAVQLGLAAGAKVVGVVRGAAKAEAVRAQGADLVIDKTVDSVIDRVKAFTDGRGADVVYDPVGGSSYAEATKFVAFDGRILIIGFAGGEIQTQRLNHVLLKNYSVVGVHFALYAAREPDSVRLVHAQLGELVRSGAVRPVVSQSVPFDEANLGLQALAGGTVIGRSVVRGASS